MNFFKTREETEAWLNKMGIKGYTIQDDLAVDVLNDVDLSDKELAAFPVRFGRVGGDFFCYSNKLTTLSGAPASVGGHFYCNGNRLTTLFGAPALVGGDFVCNENNKLATLSGAQISIGGHFYSDISDTTLRQQIKAIIEKGGDFSAQNLAGLCADIRSEISAEAMSLTICGADKVPVAAKRNIVRA